MSRSYNSASDGYSEPFGAAGWTSSLNIYLTISALPRNPKKEYPRNFQDECIYNVTGGSKSVAFGAGEYWQSSVVATTWMGLAQ